MDSQVPVLLVIFNRPDKTKKVIEALRKVKPSELFIAADGPRPNLTDDTEKCRMTREVTNEIDWPCSLETRFSDINLGCDPSVSSSINWFFDHVEQGVILEDDCVPHPDFFRFCAELFERYKDDERIMQISSLSPYPARKEYPYDYHFSRAFRCWGWGTWRRAWKMYSDSLERYDQNINEMLKSYFPYNPQYRERLKDYEKFRRGERDNWDFKWNIACYAQNGLCIVPEKNLMYNIGFDEESTHNVKPNPAFSFLQCYSLNFPLRHPAFVFADGHPEKELHKKIYSRLSLKKQCVRWARHIFDTIKYFWNGHFI